MGSDESHFNVSLIVRDKVTRPCPQTTTFEETERRAEAVSNRGPSAYQPTALPLGQIGSQYGGGGRGRLYTYRYTVTTRMISALRRAAMRAILMFQGNDGQSRRTVSTSHNLFEEKGEPKRYRTEVLPLTSLTPYR